MTHVSKRRRQIDQTLDREKSYALGEAIAALKQRATAKFDETLEIAMNLGIDPRHADQMVRGMVQLPNGTGKSVRVAKLGKILGPRGLMPNPKLGTVTPDVTAAVRAAKAGSVEFRAEKAGIVHAGIGKASFADQALAENVHAFVGAILRAKPSGAKGTYVKKVSLSSTMGPSVTLDVPRLIAEGSAA